MSHLPDPMAAELPIVILPVLETGAMIDAAGEQLPTVVVDATGHPEIADLARVHAVEGIGDIATEAAAVPMGDGTWRFFLAVIISSPVTCAFVIEFALPADRRVLDEAAGAGRLVIATTPPERAELDQPLWLAIEALDNQVADEVQSRMLIHTSAQLERSTTWFLRSRRLGDDMAVTIAHFKPGVDELSARLPELQDSDERARVDAAVARYVADGVPADLAARVVTFDTLHATLDIAEVASTAAQPVERVAQVYFDLANRLSMPWLRDRIAALPGDQHWRMLAKSAMLDDLAGLQRAITGAVLEGGPGTPVATVEQWQQTNQRALERAAQLIAELRSVPVPDSAMLSVTLRELRALG